MLIPAGWPACGAGSGGARDLIQHRLGAFVFKLCFSSCETREMIFWEIIPAFTLHVTVAKD